MRKKNNLLIIFIILLIPSISLASSKWEDEYIKFLDDSNNYRNHFKYNVDPLRCFLFDIDNDKIPELIIHTIDESNFSYNIYTYRDNKVKRIYGEMTIDGHSYFAISEDGEKLFKILHEDDKTYHDRVTKIRNRIVLDELATSSIDRNNKFESIYLDGEENELTEKKYNDLVDNTKINSFNTKDIREAIESYKESNKNMVDIKLNGQELVKDVTVINKYGTSYYPFRRLIESTGGSAIWDGDRRRALGLLDNNEIIFPIDLNMYELNEEKNILEENKTSFLYKNRTYIPIREMMESLGFKVFWNSRDNAIELTK